MRPSNLFAAAISVAALAVGLGWGKLLVEPKIASATFFSAGVLAVFLVVIGVLFSPAHLPLISLVVPGFMAGFMILDPLAFTIDRFETLKGIALLAPFGLPFVCFLRARAYVATSGLALFLAAGIATLTFNARSPDRGAGFLGFWLS